ncbi:MAG: N5-glutamine methyltransferase family protein [Acidimicrobiales bacterium]
MRMRRRAAVEERLRAAGCVAAEEEAAELVEGAPDQATLEAWIARRERGEPLAWITSRLRFCGCWVHVDPGVYVPRPQTEALARRAAALVGAGRLADLCTGTGAVAAGVKAAAPGAAVVGVDLDPRAVANARRNGVAAAVGDLAAPLASGAFDVVSVVAPYVPTAALGLLPRDVVSYEPARALDGGPDGLAVLRGAVADAARVLRDGGWLVVELGGEQDVLLAPVLSRAGFGNFETWTDDDGDLRGLAARLSSS